MEDFYGACEDSKHNKSIKMHIKQYDVDLDSGLARAAMSNAFLNAKTLYDNGASFGAKRNFPLELASQFNSVDILRMGIYKGSDVHCVESTGLSLLHHASCGNAYLCVPLLIEFGVDIERRNISGRTALHLACNFKNVEVVAQLMQAGADGDLKDKLGRVPSFYSYSFCDANDKLYISRFIEDYPEMKESRKMFKRLMVFIECNKKNPFLPRHLMWWILTKYLWSHDSLLDRMLLSEAACGNKELDNFKYLFGE